METVNLKSAIESLLFVASKPLTLKQLGKILEQDPAAVRQAAMELVEERRNAGVVVLEHNDSYQMATNSAHSSTVKDFLNQDLREKLTDATVEVLAIIAYRQPISKAEIESIRGVNSQYSIRHLLMRGMIEKTPNPHDARGFLYQTTTEFLQHMGLNSLGDLPEFEKLVSQIKLPENPQTKVEAAEITPAEPNKTEPPTESQIVAVANITEEMTSEETSQPQTLEITSVTTTQIQPEFQTPEDIERNEYDDEENKEDEDAVNEVAENNK